MHVFGRIFLYLHPVDHGIVLAQAWLSLKIRSTVILTGLEEGQAGRRPSSSLFHDGRLEAPFGRRRQGMFVFSQDGGW